MRRLEEYLDRRFPELVEAAGESIRIRSVAADPLPGMPYGREVAACLSHALGVARAWGLRAVDLDGHLGYAEIGEGNEVVLALGHLDVVPEGDGWSFPPFGGDVVQGELRGRGSQDDKAPTFSCLLALRALADLRVPLDRRVRVVFGLDEERGTLGDVAHYLRTEGPPLFGITPDGEYPVVHAEKGALKGTGRFPLPPAGTSQILSIRGGEGPGSVPAVAEALLASPGPEEREVLAERIRTFLEAQGWEATLEAQGSTLRLRCLGRAAHATLPGLGINALGRLCLCLGAALDPGDPLGDFAAFLGRSFGTDSTGASLGLAGRHPHLGDVTVNLATLEREGDELVFRLGIYVPADTLPFPRVRRTLEELFAPQGIRLVVDREVPPLLVPPEAPLIRKLRSAYHRATGESPRLLGMCGSTYAKGMPNLVPFGVTFSDEPDFAHGADERVALHRLRRSVSILTWALEELGCRREPAPFPADPR